MRHLGVTVSDLVDERLDDRARERALAHLADCAGCRAAVDAERAVRDTLRGLADAGPEPSPALRSRLLDLAGPEGPLPPERRVLSGVAPPPTPVPWPGSERDEDAGQPARGARTGPRRGGSAPVGPAGSRPGATTGSPRPGSRRSRRRIAVGGSMVAVAGALVAVMAVIGSPETGGGRGVVVPDPTVVTIEHDRSTSQLPFNEPLSVFVPNESGVGGAGQ